MAEWLNGQWAAAIIGGLANGGVRDVVVCPGSRSTPLALAAAASPRVKVWPVVDERSAAFFALGLCKGGDRPAAVLCTSGTAGAHFLPAVIEAAHGRRPLVALTADRPWELRGFGAPQTTDQTRFFDAFARVELLPEPDAAIIPHLRAVIARALDAGGPVHFNVPFREPLAEGPCPIEGEGPARGSAAGRFSTSFGDLVGPVERGVIVCGPREQDDGFGEAVHALGQALGFPVLAEAASNARFGFPQAIAHADLLLRHAPFARAHRPQLVLRFGGGLTPKTTQAWLDDSGARILVFSEDGQIVDPHHRAAAVIDCDAVDACRALTRARPATGYRESFLRADAIAERALAGMPFSEPAIARQVAAEATANLFLSSSMPIRDVDAFAAAGGKRLRVFANRGVNGIDGVTSTAAGVAAATGKPTTLLIGDLALIHDLHGLLIAWQHGVPLNVVVVNNDGGGIFSFLPVAGQTAHFEQLFGTPHGLDFAHAAALAGATHRVHTAGAPFDWAQGQRVLHEVRTDRAQNVAIHRDLHARVARALEAEGGWR